MRTYRRSTAFRRLRSKIRAHASKQSVKGLQEVSPDARATLPPRHQLCFDFYMIEGAIANQILGLGFIADTIAGEFRRLVAKILGPVATKRRSFSTNESMLRTQPTGFLVVVHREMDRLGVSRFAEAVRFAVLAKLDR